MSFKESYIKDQLKDANSAKKSCAYLSTFQFALAIFIIISYFYFVHLETQLNVNQELTDEQHQKTVKEANELFYRMDNDINRLKERLLELEGLRS